METNDEIFRTHENKQRTIEIPEFGSKFKGDDARKMYFTGTNTYTYNSTIK